MSLVVNTNVASLNAQRSLSASSNELKTAMERLSSGKKINSAADDAAGFAIAERMTAQIRGLNMATKNANDGLSMLAVIENATNDVTDMLQRMRELAIQAANDTNGSADRDFLNAEVQSLVSEIDRVASNTQYNGTTILDGTLTNKNIQVGTEAGQTVGFSVNSIKTNSIGQNLITAQTDTATLVTDHLTGGNVTSVTFTVADADNFAVNDLVGLGEGDNNHHGFSTVTAVDSGNNTITVDHTETGGTSVYSTVFGNGSVDVVKVDKTLSSLQHISSISVNTASNANDALKAITAAIEQVAGDRANYGALQNRLEYTVSNLMNVAEFTTAARSRIADADFAAESARLAKAQVLQQTGAAMLAQANAQPQLVLGLIS